MTMAVWWRDPKAVEAARRIVSDPKAEAAVRVRLLHALAEGGEKGNRDAFAALATDDDAPVLLRQAAVEALGEAEDPAAARVLVDDYAAMPADLKPMAVNALTHSRAGASALLDAIEQKKIAAGDVNANHVRQIQSLNDPDLSKRVATSWGQVKTERDPARVKVVAQMKKLIESRPPGDAYAGRLVFNKICAQCHSHLRQPPGQRRPRPDRRGPREPGRRPDQRAGPEPGDRRTVPGLRRQDEGRRHLLRHPRGEERQAGGAEGPDQADDHPRRPTWRS